MFRFKKKSRSEFNAHEDKERVIQKQLRGGREKVSKFPTIKKDIERKN